MHTYVNKRVHYQTILSTQSDVVSQVPFFQKTTLLFQVFQSAQHWQDKTDTNIFQVFEHLGNVHCPSVKRNVFLSNSNNRVFLADHKRSQSLSADQQSCSPERERNESSEIKKRKSPSFKYQDWESLYSMMYIVVLIYAGWCNFSVFTTTIIIG